MTDILAMLDRFENAAGVYERSDSKADRAELHAARRAIMEAFEAAQQSSSEQEPTAWLVQDPMIPHQPVKARGWSNEPFIGLYTADREPDAREAARMLRAECIPLYAAPCPTPAVGEREAELVKALEAFVDQLDSEELGEPGLAAKDWVGHWQKMHDDARAALRSQQNT